MEIEHAITPLEFGFNDDGGGGGGASPELKAKRVRRSAGPASPAKRRPIKTPQQQQLEAFYSAESLGQLSEEKQHALHTALTTKPLLLALIDAFPPLEKLSFEAYRQAIVRFNPKVQHLELDLFETAKDITELAAYYMYVGCQLNASEIVIPNTPKRLILKIALEEAGIGFNRAGKLNWPLPSLLAERTRDKLFKALPRTQQANPDQDLKTAQQHMNFFERMITWPGSWIVQLEEFCLKRDAFGMQARMMNALREDNFLIINLSNPLVPAQLLAHLGTATRVCFLFCDAVPLSFWSLVAERLPGLEALRTVLFVVEPTDREDTLTNLLTPQDVPRLRLQLMDHADNAVYAPQFNWDEGLFSPAFLRTEYWQKHFANQLREAPVNGEDLAPLSIIDPHFYEPIVKLFCNMALAGFSVKFITGTWTEANRIWADCIRLFNLNPAQPWFQNQRVRLLGDPLGTELVLSEIDPDGQLCSLQNSLDYTELGNDFHISELRQSYVVPLDCMIQRHHNVIIYYSAVRPLSVTSLYRIIGSAYQSVLIMAAPEMLRLLN